jgi:tRNA pseudouridine55 synthase
VRLAARPVRIDAIRISGYEWPHLDVEVDCGKGTYIRSIARDLGAALGCGGLVQTLRRTKVGPFTAEQGVGLDASPEEAKAKLQPLAAATTGMPQVFLEPEQARRFFHGQEVGTGARPGQPCDWRTVAVHAPGMKLFAIGEANGLGQLRPLTVFANPDG